MAVAIEMTEVVLMVVMVFLVIIVVVVVVFTGVVSRRQQSMLGKRTGDGISKRGADIVTRSVRPPPLHPATIVRWPAARWFFCMCHIVFMLDGQVKGQLLGRYTSQSKGKETFGWELVRSSPGQT